MSQRNHPPTDWRSIADDREKYAAYLCSREWSERKEAVHARASGKCERCKVLPISAVHHLTYARKYDEPIEDLQAICQPCHEFTHGKDDFDPTDWTNILAWLLSCNALKKPPAPFDLVADLIGDEALVPNLRELVRGSAILWAAGLSAAVRATWDAMPFVLPRQYYIGGGWWDVGGLSKCYKATGWSCVCDPSWLLDEEDE